MWPRTPNVILELVNRTKAVVRELDHFQYRKMRKLMYFDEQSQSSASGVERLKSNSENQEVLN